MIRQAIIPAAGRGARLDRPGTPKPLVHVGGEPLVVRLLRQLSGAGLMRAVVVTGYAGAEVERALTHHPALAGLQLRFVENDRWEEGLARSVLAGRDALGDGPFLVAMADHVFDNPLVSWMVQSEPPQDGVASLVDDRLGRIFDRASAVKVRLNGPPGGARVAAIGRDLSPYDAVDAGLFAASTALFGALEVAIAADPDADLTDAVACLADERRVTAVRASEVAPAGGAVGEAGWDDVDTPAGLVHAEMRLRDQRRRARVRPAGRVPAPPHAEVRFTTGAPAETRVLIGRGLVGQPARLSLIPPESASSPVFVLTDETVNHLYGERFVSRLCDAGYDVHKIVMADGEESKTLANYAYLVERILGRGIDERSVLISLGGGAVCNVCGLIASTLYRGVGLVHVPTTLMAQCDAAISHKQGVNGSRGKNLVGSYYAPRLIVVDVDVLQTLAPPLIPDGLSEVIKHALAQDRGYAEWLLNYDGDPRDPDFLEAVVRRNVALKCAIMADDPKELAAGMALQYGHTAGHPLEHLSGYSLWHGQAVAIGMMVAVRVARLLGACGDDVVRLHEELIARYGLPTRIPAGIHVPDILQAMRYNKRFLTEGTRMALVRDVGELWSVHGDYAIPVSDDVLARALEETLASPTGASTAGNGWNGAPEGGAGRVTERLGVAAEALR